jgi:large subunit ribosomal protein L30
MKLVITQHRSAIGRSGKQQDTVRALGIRRLNQTVIHNDTPQIRGMIARVSHLLRVSEQSA